MSDYLFAQPSLLSGAARVFDLFGVFDEYNFIEDGDEADALAIYLDWRAVGEDLARASEEYGRSVKKAR